MGQHVLEVKNITKDFTGVRALRDVSVSVKNGEIMGLIGENGAGKSTLLKLIAGVSEPTSGKIEINRKVAPLIELGAGFHSELTGRENIFIWLRGMRGNL